MFPFRLAEFMERWTQWTLSLCTVCDHAVDCFHFHCSKHETHTNTVWETCAMRISNTFVIVVDIFSLFKRTIRCLGLPTYTCLCMWLCVFVGCDFECGIIWRFYYSSVYLHSVRVCMCDFVIDYLVLFVSFFKYNSFGSSSSLHCLLCSFINFKMLPSILN